MSAATGSRIAKNTLYLYVRMLFSLVVTLYTSRVVLDTLGVEDFGVYSIVGGIVTFFAFFNSAMASATQRFFSYELGQKDCLSLRTVFNSALVIHLTIALLIFLLAETLGLWFLNNKLNLPVERNHAVQWVFQFSVLTFLIGVIRVPFNALIIAHEKMVAFAYLSIIEVLLKLLIVFLLVKVNMDKLVLYALLVFLVTLLIGAAYIIYCRKNFSESKLQWVYEPKLYRTLVAYSGWNLFGNIATVGKGQGLNVLLNIFFGPILNAAFSIALQVQSAANVFVNSFQMAVNPQIIKKYAAKKRNSMFNLMLQSSKVSFLLTLIIAIPLLFDTAYVLELWLRNVPEHTVLFVFLATINLLIDTLSGPLMTGIQATGKIKYYQLVVGTLLFLNLPISYLFLDVYQEAWHIYLISISLSIGALFFRLYFLKRLTGFPRMIFLRKVFFPIFLTLIPSLAIPFLIKANFGEGLIRTLVLFILSTCGVLFFGYFVGINSTERKQIKALVFKKQG